MSTRKKLKPKKFKYADQRVKIFDIEFGECWVTLESYMCTIKPEDLQPSPFASKETTSFYLPRVHALDEHPTDAQYRSFRRKKLAHAYFTYDHGIWLQLPESVGIEVKTTINMEKF